MMKGLKVGVYVDVLPSYKNAPWVVLAKWPAKVTKIYDNGHCPLFKLEGSLGTWGSTGLKVVAFQLENK